MDEVGFQAIESDTKLFELDNTSWKLSFKCETDENTNNAVLDGIPVPEITDQIKIKQETDDYFVDELASRTAISMCTVNEHNYGKVWIKSEEEEMQDEHCLDDSNNYPVMEITEEIIIKDECNDDNIFLDATVSNSALNQKFPMKQRAVVDKKPNSESFFCKNCNYSAKYEYLLISHMKEHRNQNRKNMHGSSYKRCKHCEANFRTKASLDDHVIRKHANFVASVSNKIYECPYCEHKTTHKSNLYAHLSKHSELLFSICIHCNAKLKSTQRLNDHIVRKHPEFIASVSAKIHECKHCKFKTTMKSDWVRHIILKHSETVDDYKFNVCIHCNAKFKSARPLNDHIVKKHPEFIASVPAKNTSM
ncbi:unnamed protein product [Acanthoscelides obtectus]|uniref:C2H2-type domain-containing protein n=1 Tax=Acanthoscelides obtectus TaxID=200917 RepID=A0A9P0KLQ5_ACAOB|nr:unnamed protein product [Acanthoscelides obtectus]CAK1665154.1 Zinc finger protein 236 [Acanthoscelides obtectus]